MAQPVPRPQALDQSEDAPWPMCSGTAPPERRNEPVHQVAKKQDVRPARACCERTGKATR